MDFYMPNFLISFGEIGSNALPKDAKAGSKGFGILPY